MGEEEKERQRGNCVRQRERERERGNCEREMKEVEMQRGRN